jgi:D-alanine-D-alanine ligase
MRQIWESVMIAVTVLVGGRSTEHDASLHSYVHLVSCLRGAADLSIERVVFVDRFGGRWLHPAVPSTLTDLSNTQAATPLGHPELLGLLINAGVVFSLLHGTEGEDGSWQGIAEVLDLAGNFGPVSAAAISMHKFAFANAAAALVDGLVAAPTWPVLSASPDGQIQAAVAALARRPSVIKPNSMGASLLTEFLEVPTAERLRDAVERIRPYDPVALIQACIQGAEYTVGIFADTAGARVLPIARAVTASRFLGHREKHNPGLVTAEFLDPEDRVARVLAKCSLQLFEFFGFRLWCRFDFIWDAERDRPVILEANAMPGLMRGSIYPVMLEKVGLSLADLVRAAATPNDIVRRSKQLPYTIEPHEVPLQQIGDAPAHRRSASSRPLRRP